MVCFCSVVGMGLGGYVLSLSVSGRSGVVEAFNSTSQYLDDLLNSDGTCFDSMVGRVCP